MIITDVSVKRPVFASVISLLLLAFGLVAFDRLPLREYPDIDAPVVSIETRYRGAAAPVVERRITKLIEDRISGIEGIKNIDSSSTDGNSRINIEFNVTRDIDAAANDVRDRVARVVEEAEKHLSAMTDAIRRAGDRQAETRLAAFQASARELIRTVEEDPRDLTAARKYLGVYLRGARDATAKFADIYARSRDAQARADYFALLDDLTQNFAARTRKSLLEDRGDLNIEIDVLRERLSREGVRLD